MASGASESPGGLGGKRWLLAVLGCAVFVGPPLALLQSGDLRRDVQRASVRNAATTGLGEPPKTYAERLALALALIKEGKPSDSLPLLRRCREERPDEFVVHNNLCVAYGMLGRRNEAVVACRRAFGPTASNLARSNLTWVSSITPGAG